MKCSSLLLLPAGTSSEDTRAVAGEKTAQSTVFQGRSCTQSANKDIHSITLQQGNLQPPWDLHSPNAASVTDGAHVATMKRESTNSTEMHFSGFAPPAPVCQSTTAGSPLPLTSASSSASWVVSWHPLSQLCQSLSAPGHARPAAGPSAAAARG